MLPLLFGLGGSALAGAGMLGGMGALTAGAIGSGLGSLAQGDDIGTAIGTGLMSYMGGKALGGLGGAGGGSGAGSITSNLPQGAIDAGGFAASPANPANLGLKDFGAAGMPASAMTGTQGAMNALTSNLG